MTISQIIEEWKKPYKKEEWRENPVETTIMAFGMSFVVITIIVFTLATIVDILRNPDGIVQFLLN